jgi:flavin-dependent dehydrogenase
MRNCDVLVIGGGPAGSTCAWRLSQAGCAVVVVDRARFPRDKPCAGWMTPQVAAALDLDLDEYGRLRTLQPVTAFRTGWIGTEPRLTEYGSPVSYAIRRCEFDTYLLTRSGARLETGTAVESIARAAGGWIVNGVFRAPVLVGAGGHFCPVARWLQANRGERGPVADRRENPVVAREVEFCMTPAQQRACRVEPHAPELYFCDDLRGYGWCVRKREYLNVGFGRIGCGGFNDQAAAFLTGVQQAARVPADVPRAWPGHAYLLHDAHARPLAADGALLVGDAAGLAYSASGEGIRPAVESGLLAAETLIEAAGRHDARSLSAYRDRVEHRLGRAAGGKAIAHLVPQAALKAAARTLLASPWLTRQVVLDRWFLHRRDPALSIRSIAPRSVSRAAADAGACRAS